LWQTMSSAAASRHNSKMVFGYSSGPEVEEEEEEEEDEEDNCL